MLLPKLILFDIGGVLIEYGDVFKTASRELKIPIKYFDDSFDKYNREITTGKITPQELYQLCIKENNLNSDNTFIFQNSWINDYIKIIPTYNFLIKLTQKYEIGLLSNIYKGFVPEMIKRDLIPNIKYKHIFLSCDLGMQKPDIDIYNYVLKKTQLIPSEIMFIDDKEENTIPANKMGWQTFVFQRKNPIFSVNELTKILL